MIMLGPESDEQSIALVLHVNFDFFQDPEMELEGFMEFFVPLPKVATLNKPFSAFCYNKTIQINK